MIEPIPMHYHNPPYTGLLQTVCGLYAYTPGFVVACSDRHTSIPGNITDDPDQVTCARCVAALAHATDAALDYCRGCNYVNREHYEHISTCNYRRKNRVGV